MTLLSFGSKKVANFAVKDFKSLNKRLHPITDSFPIS
jgi:hypothetical protein